ncbi:hypothetical protein ACIQNG_30780 [Streptomyces sp. NPDC091377]|uniref:hypothetical protein n=1 Tax=Streptomyces sp. NPDC091377 TaxID=3365995 RepID=UPI00380AF5B4
MDPVDLEKRDVHRPEPRGGEGCLTVAVRLPVRIVVLVLVVPVRIAWDALVVAGRFAYGTVLRPVGRALFVWPWLALWRYVLVPAGRGLERLGTVLVVVPAVWLYRNALTPIGHGLAWAGREIWAGLRWVGGWTAAGLGWLGRYLVVVPAVWLHTWILAPVGRAIAWCARGVRLVLYWTVRVLFVLPVLAVWRWVLAPVGRFLAVVGRETADALGHAWRVAGRISRAVGRFLGGILRWIFVEPLRWVYRAMLTPVGHAVRDTVLRPVADAGRAVGRATRQALATARATVRQTRADVRRALFGAPRRREIAARREPPGRDTRTLGSSTTALTKE